MLILQCMILQYMTYDWVYFCPYIMKITCSNVVFTGSNVKYS